MPKLLPTVLFPPFLASVMISGSNDMLTAVEASLFSISILKLYQMLHVCNNRRARQANIAKG